MRKLILAITIILGTMAASAQTFTKWTWSTYKLQFSAPSSFKVEENNETTYSAGNGKINLTIYPDKGDATVRQNMKGLLKAWVKENKLKYDGKIEDMEDLNGYWGVYVDGTASDNGLPTTVLLLIDPDYPNISLYVWVQYQEDQLDNAVKILKSFTPA